MKNQYFSYVRVSTAKQGEHGVSLKEQQDAISLYAERNGLRISRCFEEQETAAKRGRPIFSAMIRLLKNGSARGVIIHKIDRSARNLRDWADLGELIDAGLEVHFVNESLDLNTRGGRLSADIQAVVASDYIRNLREETKKGFYGRLKQGLYPLGAPLGYQDSGSGKPKEIHPETGPLVRQAFELYASGHYSLPRLAEELYVRGLRNRKDARVSINGLSTILNNPFYIGLLRIKKTGELFPGIHAPLVRKQMFDEVQRTLQGKVVLRANTHDFTFRRLARCATCRYALIGERQKGLIYYRCHNQKCEPTSVREEMIDSAIVEALAPLRLDSDELSYIRAWIEERRGNEDRDRANQLVNIRLQLNQVTDRMDRLTDAYIDGVLDKAVLQERRNNLLHAQAMLKEKLLGAEMGQDNRLTILEKFLELAKTASDLYKVAQADEKRDFVKKLTSNVSVNRKNVTVTLKNAAGLVTSRHLLPGSSLHPGVHRTWDQLLMQLLALFEKDPGLSFAPVTN